MKTHIYDHLELSLLGFTTLSMKLISMNNIALLRKTFLFINKLFIQSSVDVKEVIINTYLASLSDFLIDCNNRKEVVALFPFWMRTEYIKLMKRKTSPAGEIQFILHMN